MADSTSSVPTAPTIPTGNITPGLGLPSLDDILGSIAGSQQPPGSVPGLTGVPAGAMDPKIQALMSLLGLGSQFGGALIQQGQQNDALNYLKGIGGTAAGQNAGNLGNATGILGQQAGGAGSIANNSNPWSQLLSQGLIGNIGTLNNLLPGLVNPGQNQAEFSGLPTNQVYSDPNQTAELRGITNLTGNTSGMLSKAAQLLNSGGVTDTQSPLNNFAMQLMAGQTPNQQALSGAGTSLLGTNGLTPALQQALAQASGVVQNQGQTALTNQLAQTGLGLASQSPLLSGAQAASIAEDQAGRQYGNAAANAREQAGLRGQGAGTSVANGAGNQAIADTSDQALSGIANAANQARLGQQGLGLTQQQQGLNTGLGAAGLQQGLELGGLGAVGGLTGAQSGLLNTGGGLTNSAAQLQNQGGNFYNALLGLQQGNMAQGFQAGQSGVAQQSGLLQQALQDLMTGQNNSANTGNALANLYLGNQSQLGGAINSGLNSNLSALGQLGSQGANWLNAAQGALGTYANTGNSVSQLLQQPNQYAVTLNNLGGALGSSGGSSQLGNILGTAIGSAAGKAIPGLIKNASGGLTMDWNSLLNSGSGAAGSGIPTGSLGTGGTFPSYMGNGGGGGTFGPGYGIGLGGYNPGGPGAGMDFSFGF